MANRMIEGFDAIATADLTKRFTSISSTPAVSANGRNSGSCMRVTNWSNGVAKTLDLQATWIVGFAFRFTTTAPTTSRHLLAFYDAGGTQHVTFRINSGGTITALRGDVSGTVLGAGGIALAPDVWNYLEFKVTISDTVGVIVTKINGTTDLNLSSQDTKNGGTSASAQMIEFMSVTSASGSQPIDLDDLYINDGAGGVDDDFWGDVRVVTKSVDGAGNSAQFTPSAGSNFQNVDDATPDGDTTYNESSTVNHIDSMTTAALGVTGTVKGVEALVYARKTDAGVATLAPLWRIAGTDFPGTGKALSVDYTYVNQLYRVSPNTSTAWTTSELDGAELGYKRTA